MNCERCGLRAIHRSHDECIADLVNQRAKITAALLKIRALLKAFAEGQTVYDKIKEVVDYALLVVGIDVNRDPI